MLRYKIGLALCVILILAGTALVPETTASSFFSYSILALMAFGLELADGSNLGFFFIILALPKLDWGITLLMAGSALFIQAVARRRYLAPKLLLQSLAATALAVAGSQVTFHARAYARFDQPVRLILAAGVCFLALHAINWKWSDLWSFVYYPVAAAVAALFPVSLVLPPMLYLTWRSYRLYERRLERQRETLRQAVSLHLRTVETLTQAIEAKDQPAGEQTRRVQIYAVEIAKEMGLSPIEVEALRSAAMLYDIGELAVPEHIILKPGPLSPEEFEKVKIHPVVGAEILERVKFPYPVAPIVLSHHERWDGTGYPHGLKGEAIPMGARILAVADALNSLISPRHHRSALGFDEALRHISAQSGQAYDPRVVSVLRKRYRQWERLVAAERPKRDFVESIFSAQREGKMVFDLVQKLGNSLDLNETFAALNTGLRGLARFETIVVWVEHEGYLTAEYVDGAHVTLCSALKIPAGEGVSGWVAANGKSIINGDASSEWAHSNLAPERCPFRCAVSVPLTTTDVRGALTLYRMSERRFSTEDARVLSVVSRKLAGAVANGLKFRKTADQAVTDALTGLPNAGALFSRLAGSAPATVLVCDLDGFKRVNDRFGHMVGNRLLIGVADGLRRSCRGQDFVARMGGDEFVLLIENLPEDELGRRISHFRETVRSIGRQICGEDIVDASFGAAFYPKDGTDANELLAAADHRMYRRKNEQKAGVRRIEQRRVGT